jgi:hypothetical protein
MQSVFANVIFSLTFSAQVFAYNIQSKSQEGIADFVDAADWYRKSCPTIKAIKE